MPIDRKLLHADAEAATAFLGSRKGTILHEAGHYVAANMAGMLSGHLIVSATSERAAAAFVFDDRSAPCLASDPERAALVSAGGYLAEYYFCGEARILRSRNDIATYQSIAGCYTADRVVARWKRHYLDHFAAQAACIEDNFDRCVRYCSSSTFLIDDHHVIPSCMLRSPRWRGLGARLDEAMWTYPMKARRRALEDFRAAQAEVLVVRIA
jgi:hypothetical protein